MKQHSVPFALAVRRQWLHPSDTAAKESLKAATEELKLNGSTVDCSSLFPRVFSDELKVKKSISASVVASDSSSASPEFIFCARKLRYLLVLDLAGKYEITNFPVIVIDAVAGCELGRFHRYVQPVHLFDGCALNDSSPAIPFTAVLKEFDSWLRYKVGRGLDGLGHDWTDTAFVCGGDWDCKHVHTQCGISGIAVPSAFSQWVNITRVYGELYGPHVRGMKNMLAKLRLLGSNDCPKFGFRHLGMDAETIGRCVVHLLDQGVDMAINGWEL